MKSAFLDSQASLQRIERANRARAASQAEFDLETTRYDTGLGDILELIDAQRRLTEDGAEVVRAQAAASTAEAALARATAEPRPNQ